MYFFVEYDMAGILGFEPRMPDSESGALPLGDIPMYVRMVRKRSSLDSFGIGATSLGDIPIKNCNARRS